MYYEMKGLEMTTATFLFCWERVGTSCCLLDLLVVRLRLSRALFVVPSAKLSCPVLIVGAQPRLLFSYSFVGTPKSFKYFKYNMKQ